MKKNLVIFVIILDLLAVGIIPLNLYFINIPEYISIVFAICMIALHIWIWVKDKRMKVGKVILSLISTLVIVISLFGSYCNPYWNSISFRKNKDYTSKPSDDILTYEEAVEDLRYAMKYIKKVHPALYHGMPEKMRQQYEMVLTNLKEYETIDVCSLSREIETIFSTLADAHTFVKGSGNNRYYLKYIEQHSQVGDEIVKINGVSIEDLLHQNLGLYSFEAESFAKSLLYNDLMSSEGLNYLGISVDDGVVYTYQSENGDTQNYTFYKDDFVTYEEYVEFNGIKDDPDEKESFVSYEIDEENSLAILSLTSCINNEEYQTCLKEMFDQVKELGIHNVAVDLRYNAGGSSSVANEFLRYIDVDNYKQWESVWRLGAFEIHNEASVINNKKYEESIFNGRVFLLTSENTFSSAMNFAQYIKDNHIGTIIGEASGNDPNSYGDIGVFKLPNSELLMQISTKKWYRIDRDCKDKLIEPDISCRGKDAINKLYDVLE